MSATLITPRAVGYIRVSTSEQQDSGAGLAAQRATINLEITRRAWQLQEIYADTASGKSMARREGLQTALGLLDAGEADVLVVAKLDRLSRSLLDFAALMERTRQRGWSLVALDLGVDTTTPAGEMIASLMATFAQYERRIIGQRTREALAEKRAAGVRLGRPPALALEVRTRIVSERQAGATYREMAERLNADRVPTAHGGEKWHPATVRSICIATMEDTTDA